VEQRHIGRIQHALFVCVPELERRPEPGGIFRFRMSRVKGGGFFLRSSS
jgi:hypothetical protein